MVIPEREMPGTSAAAWAIPMARAPPKPTASSPRSRRPTRSAYHRMAAPTIRATATIAGRRVTASTGSARNAPMSPAGIVATTSTQASRRSGSPPMRRSKSDAIPARMRRTQSAAK